MALFAFHCSLVSADASLSSGRTGVPYFRNKLSFLLLGIKGSRRISTVLSPTLLIVGDANQNLPSQSLGCTHHSPVPGQ